MANEQRLCLIQHLEELRSRLIVSILAIFFTTALTYIFSDVILYLLRAPAGTIKLQGFSPMDGFMIRFQVALYGGISLAAPIWIYQLLRFIEPGLLPDEKKVRHSRCRRDDWAFFVRQLVRLFDVIGC